MYVPFHSEFHYPRTFGLHRMPQCPFLVGIIEGSHHINLSSASANSIFATAVSPFECEFPHLRLHDNAPVPHGMPVIDILGIVSRLVFEGCPDKRSYALAVVFYHRFTQIIIVGAAAHFLASETGDRAA